MKKNVFKASYTLTFILVLAANIGCSPNSGDPFEAIGFDSYDSNLSKRIANYQIATTPNSKLNITGNPALYIDFSSGINKAFKDPTIYKMMMDCFNVILNKNLDVFKLGSKQIRQLSVINTTQLGLTIGNKNEYVDIYAPIQKAVEEIVTKSNDALLITDFEEWQDGVEILNTAYLKIPFSTWLASGNSIHFYIADYIEGKVNKHIYFTLFIAKGGDADNMLSKLDPYLGSLNKFELSSNTYKLSNKYQSEKSGGNYYDDEAGSDAAKNILDLKKNYTNGLKDGKPFEFYPFGLDWITIADTYESYKKQNQFDHFFRNLFVDLSNEDSYIYEDFTVKVTDVTEDFNHFAECAEVLNHKPKIVKGTNGEDKFADDEMDDLALYCYEPNGKIKDEWVYTNKNSTEMTEVFLLNQVLLKNTKNTEKAAVELGVLFDPKFKVENITNQDGLIRVDIILIKANPNTHNPILDKFKWINEKNIVNESLYQSLITSLEEPNVIPNNKTIYSYYIKTLQ